MKRVKIKKINRLKAWRLNKGLTQLKMSKLLGIAEFTYIRYENFLKKSLRIELLEKILSVTNGEVTPNDLIGLSQEQVSTIKNKASPKNKINIGSDEREKVLSHHYNARHKKLVSKVYSNGCSV